jgi:hypothetical protein
MSCGASNGEIDEGKRIMNEVLDAAKSAETDDDSAHEEFAPEDGEPLMVDVSTPDDGPAANTRKRKGAKGKK